MQVSLTTLGCEDWFNHELEPFLGMMQDIEEKGIEAVSMADHVVMSTDFSNYPYGYGGFDPNTPFLEPVVLATAIAARTKSLRITTGVLLAPLRPATLLAKQLATLDQLAKGRLDLAVGVGWQKAEYDFSGIPWEGRFGRMVETIEACRELWTRAPAHYHGKHINFDDAYCRPFPYQKGGVPVLFGVAPSEINIERMARAADGWAPLGFPLDVIEDAMGRIRKRLAELGRDPAEFRLRCYPEVVRENDRVNWEATLASLPRLARMGCTELDFMASVCCASPDELHPFIDTVNAARRAV